MSGITDWEAYFRVGGCNKSAGRRLGAADYYVDGEHYIIKMDVPGITIDDINISIIDSKHLVIKGKKDIECSKHTAKNYLSCERAHGSFKRIFNLLDNVPCDISSITAELIDGVLIVSIPINDYIPPKEVNVPITNGCKSNITLTTIDGDSTEPELRRSTRKRYNRSKSLN